MSIVSVISAQIRWISAAKTPASAVAYSFASRVAILVANVATGVIVARTLGPAGRGAASAISLWPLVISGLMTLGVPAALRYELRRHKDRSAALFSIAIIMSGSLGVLASIAGFTIVPHLLGRYPAAVISFAQLMMIFVPAMLCNTTLQAFYESQSDFRRSNALSYIPPVLTLTSLILLNLVHRISPYSVAFVYEAPFALVTISTIVRLRRFLRLPPRIGKRVLSLLHYGGRAYGIDILNTIANQIDQAMVVGLLSSRSFGFYVVAMNGARILAMIGSSLTMVLLPKAAGSDGPRAIEMVSRSGRLVFASTLLALLALIVALPFLIPLAYGEEYASVIGLTRLLTIAVLFSATTGTFSQAFMATGRPEIASLIEAAGVIATVPLMLTMIPRFGLAGAAYATVLSNALRLALILVAYPLILHRNIPGLLPTKQDISQLYGRFRSGKV